MVPDKNILIIGSDGFIGRALMVFLRKAGRKVIGTTRRHALSDDTHPYLDLSGNAEAWQCRLPVSAAVICAGVTKLDICKRDPAVTASINVEAVSMLAKKLAADGAFVVYLSSNQVFDGSTPYSLPTDPVSPITEYGRQKAGAERLIGELGDSVAIVRFTKIIGDRNPLFSEWLRDLKEGKVIRPFSDMRLAPVPLSFVLSILYLVMEHKSSGILQVSGNKDVSYADVGYRAARLINADPCLVRPVKAAESGKYTEKMPLNTTLNINRLKSLFGIEPPDVWCTIDKVLNAHMVEKYGTSEIKNN